MITKWEKCRIAHYQRNCVYMYMYVKRNRIINSFKKPNIIDILNKLQRRNEALFSPQQYMKERRSEHRQGGDICGASKR